MWYFFGTVLTVWYFLGLFWQCGIFWDCSDSVVFFCFSFYLKFTFCKILSSNKNTINLLPHQNPNRRSIADYTTLGSLPSNLWVFFKSWKSSISPLFLYTCTSVFNHKRQIYKFNIQIISILPLQETYHSTRTPEFWPETHHSSSTPEFWPETHHSTSTPDIKRDTANTPEEHLQFLHHKNLTQQLPLSSSEINIYFYIIITSTSWVVACVLYINDKS